MPKIGHYFLVFFISSGLCGILDFAKPKLSDYQIFEDPLKNQTPRENVIPYQISTPLFTDYAKKLRFIILPSGEKMSYINPEQIEFPIGTILVKTFYYPENFQQPADEWQIIETRLLINTVEGWVGFPYVWNDEQTDAFLEITGDRKNVSWIDSEGENQSVNYVVPNFNMCKGCHVKDNKFLPIGPKPRLLNYEFNLTDSKSYDQLENFKKLNVIINLPEINSIPTMADWKDEKYPLHDRARAYLDVNCGHCHNAKGPAMTSGLFLDYLETDLRKLGINKTPVAAGRGSGDLKYNIVPGKANESILIYRMESNDSGILMPEIGRKLVHKEGVSLIREWINSMDTN